MGFPQILSQRTFRVATRTGAPLVVAVLGTTGSVFFFFLRDFSFLGGTA